MKFQNVSLKWKLFGLAGLPLGLLTLEGVLELTGKPSHGVTIVLMLVGYLLGGAITLVTVRRADGRHEEDRQRGWMHARRRPARICCQALQALAAGDLTVELHASTAAVIGLRAGRTGPDHASHRDLPRRGLACYDAYNQTAEKLRELIGSVAATAASVNASSQEMSSTAEEAGKATSEIAQAITDVAEGAERQARMAESVKQLGRGDRARGRRIGRECRAHGGGRPRGRRSHQARRGSRRAGKPGDAISQGLKRGRVRSDPRAGGQV